MTTPRWYAITTKPQHEKSVVQQLEAKSIETFLPLLTTPSSWKDRKVLLERPLFPGYVFTHIALNDRSHVLSTPSVVRMLSFGGTPAAIEDDEIDAVRRCLEYGEKPRTSDFPEKGEFVRVKSGSLQGLQGVVIRSKQQSRIVVSISLIHKSISAEIDFNDLEVLDRETSMVAAH